MGNYNTYREAILGALKKFWEELQRRFSVTQNANNGTRITLPDGTYTIVSDTTPDSNTINFIAPSWNAVENAYIKYHKIDDTEILERDGKNLFLSPISYQGIIFYESSGSIDAIQNNEKITFKGTSLYNSDNDGHSVSVSLEDFFKNTISNGYDIFNGSYANTNYDSVNALTISNIFKIPPVVNLLFPSETDSPQRGEGIFMPLTHTKVYTDTYLLEFVFTANIYDKIASIHIFYNYRTQKLLNNDSSRSLYVKENQTISSDALSGDITDDNSYVISAASTKGVTINGTKYVLISDVAPNGSDKLSIAPTWNAMNHAINAASIAGGSGDVNVVETVKVNGVALTPDATKAVDVSVPTTLAELTGDTTHRVVTDNEKNTWNGKQDAISDLATIRSNAAAGAAKVSNVQSDWDATSGEAQILNKPTIPEVGSNGLTSLTGDDGKAIADTQTIGVTIDGVKYVLVSNVAPNSSTKMSVAPTWDALNQVKDSIPTVPTKTSELTNDSGFLTSAPVTSVNGQTGAVSLTIPMLSSNGPLEAHTGSQGTYYQLKIKSEDGGSEVSSILGTNDTTEGWTQAGDSALATVGLIKKKIDSKQDTINDLATIRSGAAAGATALQSYTETDPVFSASAASQISIADILNWNGKTNNVGTVTGVKVNGTTKNPISGVVDLGTVLTEHQDISDKASLSGPNTFHDDNTFGGTVYYEDNLNVEGDITFNNSSCKITRGTEEAVFVPKITTADNGKVLMVVNGKIQLVMPTAIYSGSSAPASTQGNNGDLYMQV